MQLLTRTIKKARGLAIGVRYGFAFGGYSLVHRQRVTLDIHYFQYSRYFYSFVKFLTMEGVEVDLRFRPETLYALSQAQYGNMVLTERLVRLVPIGGDRSSNQVIGDLSGTITLSPNNFLPSRNSAVYDIPMAQHPLMYSRSLWNRSVESGKPQPTILFIGNCESEPYSKIDSGGVFNVIGRVRLLEILRRNGLIRELAAGKDLAGFVCGAVTIIDSSSHKIPMEHFRQTVSEFGFFLCAPGVFMPLCHNLVEAMSVGVIPLIQRSYAELLEPVLEHGNNAIIFDGEADLIAKVSEALDMECNQIRSMKQAVLAYYESYLSPHAVVSRVLHSELRAIRMLAGKRSVALLCEQRAAGSA